MMYNHYSMASEHQQPDKKGKKYPNDSKTEMTIVMLPSDANPKGNIFGGVILKLQRDHREHLRNSLDKIP
jgi:hypothetical protein